MLNQLLSLPFENINSHREPISHFESSRRQNRTLLAAIVSINVSLTRLTAVPLAHTSPFRIPVQSTSSMAMPRYHSHLAEFLSFSDSHLSSQSRIEMFVFLRPPPSPPPGDRACQQQKYVSAILASSTKWLKVGQQVSSKRNAITKCYYLALNRGCSAPG